MFVKQFINYYFKFLWFFSVLREKNIYEQTIEDCYLEFILNYVTFLFTYFRFVAIQVNYHFRLFFIIFLKNNTVKHFKIKCQIVFKYLFNIHFLQTIFFIYTYTNRSIGKINSRLCSIRKKIGHVTVIIMDIPSPVTVHVYYIDIKYYVRFAMTHICV